MREVDEAHGAMGDLDRPPRGLESTRNEGFRVIRFLDGLSPAAALLAERSQRSLESQAVRLPQHHLGKIDQRGLVDRGVQVVGELERERRIRIAELRQPHLAVQVLIGVEIARNGPGVGIGRESELRPLAVDPERVDARRGIRVPEAEPVVKHAENDLQAHTGVIFQLEGEFPMVVLHLLVLAPGLAPGLVDGPHLRRLEREPGLQVHAFGLETQRRRLQEGFSIDVHRIGGNAFGIQREPDGDPAIRRSDGGLRGAGRKQERNGRENGLFHRNLYLFAARGPAKGPGPVLTH